MSGSGYGHSTYVRVQVLTNAGALDPDKLLAVVDRLSAVAAEAAADPSLVDGTWVLLTEAPYGGWGLAGHANTDGELVTDSGSGRRTRMAEASRVSGVAAPLTGWRRPLSR